ncbi:chorismate mutase [Alistipes sp. Z76]|nr:chorismate mutase [Alistipes sp. Z76]NCE69343.1 chorismate mutase [Muribaculaceae bacterium M3]
MLKIAIQGYEGCFHHIAANDYFGRDISIMPQDTFRGVAAAVKRGEADMGMMAIENSIAGSIIANYSILQDAKLQVAGEIYLPIKQNLMVLPDVELEDIREVESHPMALLQCIDYLDSRPWKLVESEDTALSARHIAEKGLRHTAAIASELAAEMFGLKIIAPEINTIKSNYTRFMVLKRHDHNIDPHADKASLYFKTDHREGSLLRTLSQLQGINLSKLQSYPIPSEPWHYLFHIDLEFGCLDDYIRNLDRLQEAAEEVHVYGVYRSGLRKDHTAEQ